MKSNPHIHLFCLFVTLTILTACGSDESSSNDPPDPPEAATYRITLANLTHSQPLAPMAVILHNEGYLAWEAGIAASTALEVLAEGGSPADLIQTADNDADVFATAAGGDVILPGSSESVEVTMEDKDSFRLTVASMLVNTNDAFGGISAVTIDQFDVGQSATFTAPAYDAGTESNSESAAAIPGPAAGGEGFNPARDDVDFVRIHPGAITAQDGLENSALSGAHRWDNPVFKLIVTRVN